MKKRYIIILPLVLLFIRLGIFLNSESSLVDLETADMVESYQDEKLVLNDGVLYLVDQAGEEEIDRFDESIESISWSENGNYYLLNSTDKTYLYLRDGNILLKEFKTNGKPIFSKDSTRLLLGLREARNDLAIYNIENKYMDQILEAREDEVYLPLDWKDREITYLEELSGEKRSLTLENRAEDSLMDLIKNDGDSGKVIKLLGTINREDLYRRYGDNSIIEVLDYLQAKSISDLENMKEMIDLSDSFVGQEHHKYVEVLASMYLSDINNFVRALTAFEDKTKDIAYALHDLKIYEREGSNLTEDLNSIVMSKDLSPKEKQVGMDLISTYGDCGA